MSGEAPTAETPTDQSILGIRRTSDDERPSAGGDVQGSYEPTAGAKRRKKSTPQSITQQALEAMHARQHAYTRGIGGIGVAPEKTEAKAAVTPAGGGGVRGAADGGG